MKKKIYSRACISRALLVSLVMLCFLFSSYLSAQSFSDNPLVFTSSGTIISEAKSTQSKVNNPQIFVVKGTLVTGADNLVIAYLDNTPTKKKSGAKKSAEKQTLTKQKPKQKQNTLHKTPLTFVLKPAAPGKLLLAVNKSVNGAVQTNTNNYREYQAITVAQTCLVFYKNSVKKKTLPQNKSSKGRLSINTLFVRPPPVSDFV